MGKEAAKKNGDVLLFLSLIREESGDRMSDTKYASQECLFRARAIFSLIVREESLKFAGQLRTDERATKRERMLGASVVFARDLLGANSADDVT